VTGLLVAALSVWLALGAAPVAASGSGVSPEDNASGVSSDAAALRDMLAPC
jgi:hypothetical protein